MEHYSGLRVPELKKELKRRGLNDLGAKRDLVSRLVEHDKQTSRTASCTDVLSESVAVDPYEPLSCVQDPYEAGPVIEESSVDGTMNEAASHSNGHSPFHQPCGNDFDATRAISTDLEKTHPAGEAMQSDFQPDEYMETIEVSDSDMDSGGDRNSARLPLPSPSLSARARRLRELLIDEVCSDLNMNYPILLAKLRARSLTVQGAAETDIAADGSSEMEPDIVNSDVATSDPQVLCDYNQAANDASANLEQAASTQDVAEVESDILPGGPQVLSDDNQATKAIGIRDVAELVSNVANQTTNDDFANLEPAAHAQDVAETECNVGTSDPKVLSANSQVTNVCSTGPVERITAEGLLSAAYSSPTAPLMLLRTYASQERWIGCVGGSVVFESEGVQYPGNTIIPILSGTRSSSHLNLASLWLLLALDKNYTAAVSQMLLEAHEATQIPTSHVCSLLDFLRGRRDTCDLMVDAGSVASLPSANPSRLPRSKHGEGHSKRPMPPPTGLLRLPDSQVKASPNDLQRRRGSTETTSSANNMGQTRDTFANSKGAEACPSGRRGELERIHCLLADVPDSENQVDAEAKLHWLEEKASVLKRTLDQFFMHLGEVKGLHPTNVDGMESGKRPRLAENRSEAAQTQGEENCVAEFKNDSGGGCCKPRGDREPWTEHSVAEGWGETERIGY